MATKVEMSRQDDTFQKDSPIHRASLKSSENLSSPSKEELDQLRQDVQGVEISLHFYQLLNLNPHDQSFFADFNIRFQFHAIGGEAEIEVAKKMIEENNGKYFSGERAVRRALEQALPSRPHFMFSNSKGPQPQMRALSIDFQKSGRVDVSVMASGLFSIDFQLQHFPFDVQALRIGLRILPDLKRTGPFYFLDGSPAMVGQGFYKEVANYGVSEWYVYKRMTCAVSLTQGKAIGWYHNPCVFYAAANVRRKNESYIVRMVFTSVILVAIAFFAFALPVEDVAFRLGVSNLMTLSLVAFKLSLSTSVPNVPYQTVLDILFNSSFLVVFGISVSIVFVDGIVEPKGQEQANLFALFLFIALYLTLLLSFAIRGASLVKKANATFGELLN